MNTADPYLVNVNSHEYAEWQPAHFARNGDVRRFYWMTLDREGDKPVLLHDSCIRSVPIAAKPIEDEMRRLLELPGLVPEARKLITAALQAQATGKSEFSI